MARFSLALIVCLSTAPLSAADAPIVPIEWRDDATLHDIQFVGSSGWACGDRGTLWRSQDAGEAWQLVELPTQASLYDVCFLTDRIGWVCGGEFAPWTRTGSGVLFYTADGGKNWKSIGTPGLPVFHQVRFFSLEDGVAVGSRTTPFGTGLFETHDGGLSWQEVDGSFDREWRTGAFVTPSLGIVAGRNGAVAVWGGRQLSQAQLQSLGPITLRDVSLDRDLRGWIVGDGAAVMKTARGGAVWEAPAGNLTAPLRDFVDFRCVAHVGDHVWIAGRPGSAVWHSSDDGRTWDVQHTGQTVPLASLHFSDAHNGYACGELGMILKTSDGGATWRAVRGDNRRAALLVVSTRPSKVPFSALAQLSGELGYRSRLMLPVLDETGQTLVEADDFDLRWNAASISVGGSGADDGTRLPIGLPDVQTDPELLLAEWNRRTDGRLREVIFGDLVSRIRTWRPDVILLDRAETDDATARLINEAIVEAARQSGDPTRFHDWPRMAALRPWMPKRIYERSPTDPSGQWKLRGKTALPRVGNFLEAEVALASSFLLAVPPPQPALESYFLTHALVDEPIPAAGDLFAGLSIAPGSSARRALRPIDESMLALPTDASRRREQFQALVETTLQGELDPARAVALLDGHLARFPDQIAAEHLLQLARRQFELAHWDAAEAMLIALVNRYSLQPAGQSGMTDLLLLWSSQEIAWQRTRHVGTPRASTGVDLLQVQRLLESPIVVERGSDPYRPPSRPDAPPLGDVLQTSSIGVDSNGFQMRAAAVDRWQRQAGALGVVLWQRNPALFRKSEIQLPLMAALRNPNAAQAAERLLRQVSPEQFGLGTTIANWLQPPRMPSQLKTAACRRVDARPVLDGALIEECWQDAAAIVLGRDDLERKRPAQPFVFIARDDEYLYLAGNFAKYPGVRMDGPQTAGRRHDQDVSGHDRVSFAIDLDRDFLSYYEIVIDERGWTQERCVRQSDWNPEMFIAVDADETHWRFEAAIRLSDLVPGHLSPGNGWGLAVSRTIPGEGWQNWEGTSLQVRPQIDNFGILKFE